ncbi:MAG: DUF2207 domain-containing protein, partial [Planctomycetota bacterium]
MTKRISLVWLAALVAGLATQVSHAGSRRLVYDRITVTMTVNRDTSIDVVETQEVTLSGAWNGLYRDYARTGCDRIEILGLSEAGQAYLQGSVSKKRGYVLEEGERNSIRVRWRSRNVNERPYNEQKTSFRIKYRLIGAIGQYRNVDVLHWKPIISDRRYAVNEAVVKVIIPEEREDISVIFFTEAPGARWEIDKADGRVINFTARNIPRKDKFEFKISLPKGILDQYFSGTNWYYYNAKAFVLPVCIVGWLGILILTWFFVGRDPRPGPFEGQEIDARAIAPGLSGIMFDESFDNRDLTATILDLARRGWIEITEASEGESYTFKLLRDVKSGDVADFEHILLKGLFGRSLKQGDQTSTSSLMNKFYKTIPKVKRAAWQEIEKLGWFKITPRRAITIFVLIGLALLIPSIALAATQGSEILFFVLWSGIFAGFPGILFVRGIRRAGWKGLLTGVFFLPFIIIGLSTLAWRFITLYKTGTWQADVGIAGILMGIMTIAAGGAMARKSELGATVAEKIRRLRNTLKNSPALETKGFSFADVLPWAVALGLLKKTLGNYTSPEHCHTPYYRRHRDRDGRAGVLDGASVDSLSEIADNFNAMTSSIASTLTSAPRSSGSSGSG